MERAWPLAGLSVATIVWLTLSPSPRAFIFESAGPPPSWLPRARDLTPEQMLLADRKLDINRATVAELVALPEIGEGLAQRIVAARRVLPVGCEAELLRIPGLSAGRLARLRPFLKPLPQRCREQAEGLEYLP